MSASASNWVTSGGILGAKYWLSPVVAVNRTFDENVLRDGLKNDTLGAILFPRDPVSNAPAANLPATGRATSKRSGSRPRPAAAAGSGCTSSGSPR